MSVDAGNFTGWTNNTYSTCPSATTLDMRTPSSEEDSPDDYRTAPRTYHCSLVSLGTRHRSSAFSKHVCRPPIIWPDSSVSKSDHGAYTELLVMPSERMDASKVIATPVSEKKLRWVKSGSSTKFWTQSRTPRTSSSLIATQSSFIVNLYSYATGPRIASAVNLKTW